MFQQLLLSQLSGRFDCDGKSPGDSPIRHNITVYIPNCNEPLRFEAINPSVGPPRRSTEVADKGTAVFRDPNGWTAHRAALKASDIQDTDEARRAAQAILEEAPDCPEAYVVLAECAPSYEKALEFYQKGVDVGNTMLTEESMKAIIKKKDVWSEPACRGWLRCIRGAANTLRKLGRYKEAYRMYQRLIKLDTVQPTMSSTWVNWHPLVVDVLLGLKEYDIARKFMRKHQNDTLDMVSSYSYKTMSSLLLYWEKNRPKPPRAEDRKVPDIQLCALFSGMYEVTGDKLGPKLDKCHAIRYLIGFPGYQNPRAEDDPVCHHTMQGSRSYYSSWARWGVEHWPAEAVEWLCAAWRNWLIVMVEDLLNAFNGAYHQGTPYVTWHNDGRGESTYPLSQESSLWHRCCNLLDCVFLVYADDRRIAVNAYTCNFSRLSCACKHLLVDIPESFELMKDKGLPVVCWPHRSQAMALSRKHFSPSSGRWRGPQPTHVVVVPRAQYEKEKSAGNGGKKSRKKKKKKKKKKAKKSSDNNNNDSDMGNDDNNKQSSTSSGSGGASVPASTAQPAAPSQELKEDVPTGTTGVLSVVPSAAGGGAATASSQASAPQASASTHSCSHCGVSGVKLLKCTGCNHSKGLRVLYCSSACQQAAWPKHKAVCARKTQRNERKRRGRSKNTV